MKTLCRYGLLIAALVIFTAAAQKINSTTDELAVQKWIQWVQKGARWDVAPNGELLIPVAYDSAKEMFYFTVHTMLDNYPIVEGYRPKEKTFPEPSIHLEWVDENGNGHAYVAALQPRIAAQVYTTLENLQRKGGIFFAGTWEYCKDFGKPFANSECAEIFKKRLPFLFPD
ncbi:MAG: hypothetical protein HZC03_01610 [Candidatus Lloydbacteria bacterium]|nr:hypothetical protein [Candidatus Lloydbacteria bacterium]